MLNVFAAEIECVIIIGVLISAQNPVGKAFASLRDLLLGYVEQCRGKFEDSHCQIADTITAHSQTIGTPQNLLSELSVDPERVQSMERLPFSGRVWTLNETIVDGWVAAPWEGITSNPKPMEKKWSFPYAEKHLLPWQSDLGFFVGLITVFLTILLHTVFHLPPIYLPVYFISIWFIVVRLMYRFF